MLESKSRKILRNYMLFIYIFLSDLIVMILDMERKIKVEDIVEYELDKVIIANI